MHARVFNSNLNGKCVPAASSIAKELVQAIRPFLRDVRRFACALMRVPIRHFPTLCVGVKPVLNVDVDLLPLVYAVRELGFTFNRSPLSAVQTFLRSERLFHPDTNSLIPSTTEALALREVLSLPGGEGVVMYLDKNSGMGAVLCPRLYWHVLRDALWSNPDYSITTHSPTSLHVLHSLAYKRGDWKRVACYRSSGKPANEPFLFGKNKSNAKYRTVLSAYHHCLKRVHARVAAALRFCLMAVTGDGAFDLNPHDTLNTPSKLTTCTNNAVNMLSKFYGDRTGVDWYAGDISSMFDKLPCSIVMRAVDYVLELASKTAGGTRYQLRPHIVTSRLSTYP